MKKKFLFAAMASIAFASCTTDEKVFDGTDESNESRFTAAQYSAQSRAEHDPGAVFNQDVTIWSWYNGKGGNENTVIAGDVYNRTYNSTGGFTNGNNYYWPVNGTKLDFVSVPTDMLVYLDGGVPTRDNSGNTSLTFNIDKDDNYHNHNLMTTQVLQNLSSGSAVPLLFRHLFAKIKVNVSQKVRIVNNEARWTVTLKSLKFIGLHDKGTVIINNAWTAANGGTDCAWASTEAQAANATDESRVWTIFSGSKDLYTFTTEPTPGSAEDKTATGTEAAFAFTDDYYMLPQELLAGVQKVVISYDITTDYLGNPTQPNTTVSYDNQEFNLSSVAGVTQWFMNKVITYNISIDPSETLTPITFTVNEEEWGTGTGSSNVDPIP